MNDLMTDLAVRRSIERALISNTPESLVEVRFKNGRHLVLEFIFAEPVQEDDREMASMAETEIISDLPPSLTSEGRFIERGGASDGYEVAFRRAV